MIVFSLLHHTEYTVETVLCGNLKRSAVTENLKQPVLHQQSRQHQNHGDHIFLPILKVDVKDS